MSGKNVYQPGIRIRKIVAAICLVISCICLAWCIISSITNNRNSPYEKIVLTPKLEYGSVSFRGASVDGDWYNPVTIISANTSWVEIQDKQCFMATDGQPLELLLPKGDICELVFYAGPQQGQVIIATETDCSEINLFLDTDDEYGVSYRVQSGKMPRTYAADTTALLAVVSIMAIMLSALWFLGKKEQVNSGHKVVRNSSVEFVRFVIIMCVCLHHYGGYCPGGYLGVDFFFILSGFLLMKQFSSQNIDTPPLIASMEYVKKRYVKLISYYLVPAGTSLVVGICLDDAPTLQAFIMDSFWELSMLEGFGFTTNLLIGPGWFCSALLICSYFIYLLLSLDSKRFICFIAPISILLIFGYMSHRVGHLNYWLQFETDTVISIALWRGFADMSLGCLCYVVSMRLGAKLDYTYRYFSAIFEIFCLGGILYTITALGATRMDFIIVFLMAGLIASLFIGNSVLCKFLNNRVCRSLGKISVSIYLTHGVLGRIDWAQLFPISWHDALKLYVVFVIVFSYVVTAFVDRVVSFRKK